MGWLEGRAGLRRLQRVLEIVGGQALILSGLSMLNAYFFLFPAGALAGFTGQPLYLIETTRLSWSLSSGRGRRCTFCLDARRMPGGRVVIVIHPNDDSEKTGEVAGMLCL